MSKPFSEHIPNRFPESSEPLCEWVSKQEAAMRLGVSEKTIENRVKDGLYFSEKRNGRAFVLIPISERESEGLPNEKALLSDADEENSFLSEEVGRLRNQIEDLRNEMETVRIHAARLEEESKNKDEIVRLKDQTIAKAEQDNRQLSEEVGKLRNQAVDPRKEIESVRIQAAHLEGELKSKDDIIRAKDQAINAANAVVMLLENQKSPPIAIPTQTTEEKKGWVAKLFGRT